MRPLTPKDIVRIWEWAEDAHPADQALIILVVACPGRSREDLAALSIGRRDALLFDAREQTFGSSLRGYADCPRCSAQLEFSSRISDLRVEREPGDEQKEFEMREAGFRLRFRLPDSNDLAALAESDDLAAARSLLARRCLLQASLEGSTVAYDKLPERVLKKLASRMSECDPQADVNLNLECPACGNQWQVIFDIASFFMEEINTLAKRLMREVHALARAYGWRESDILAMSARRREFYVGMVS